MRLYRWLPMLLAVILIIGIVPAQAEDTKIKTKNNIVTVEAISDDETLPTLLSEEEVSKIDRLQSELFLVLPASPVSPDDQTLFVTAADQMGFLNIHDGSTVELPADLFGSYVPLPFLGVSDFTWLDTNTLGCLALNFDAQSPEESVVILGIHRTTFNITTAYLPLPEDIGIVSVSPNLTRFLAVIIPPEEQATNQELAAALKMARVQVTHPNIQVASQTETLQVPQRMAGRINQARTRFADLLNRFALMEEPTNDEVVVTQNTLDLIMFNALTSERTYVTTLPEASEIFGQAWSPDSSRFAFSVLAFDKPDEERYTFDGALISEMLYRDATGNLPPSDNPILQNNNTYVVDLNSHNVQMLRAASAGAPPLLSVEAWAPDNESLLVKAWYPARIKGRTHPIYIPQFSERSSYRFYTKDLQQTGELNTDILSAGLMNESVVHFVSRDEIIFRSVVGNNRHPYYYNRVSGELRNIADRAGTYGVIVHTNHSRQLITVYHSYTNPPELYRLGWDGKGFARLTWFNEELRQFANLREDPVTFKLTSGAVRTGTLIQPAGAAFPPKNQPLIVWQEGGPGVMMINSWATNVENPYSLLPTFGFPVLVVPLAGRGGYTPATFNALVDRGNVGQIDIDEQAEIVRQLISRGWANKSKVGIVGCSYGGYFTWQSIIRHPDLYTAANPQCALVDLVTEWTRGYSVLAPYMEGLPPYANTTEYRNDSPSYNANKVKAAVLSFHGTNDFLPVVLNENLHLQLYNRKLNVRMLRFVGEGHGLAEPANQLYAAQQQVDWFRTYLKP